LRTCRERQPAGCPFSARRKANLVQGLCRLSGSAPARCDNSGQVLTEDAKGTATMPTEESASMEPEEHWDAIRKAGHERNAHVGCGYGESDEHSADSPGSRTSEQGRGLGGHQ
jgi:hypothetical protein